jgi:hypothetical protein
MFYCIGASVITIVFFDTMSDFATVIPQKELVYLLKLTMRTSSYKCAEDVCMVGLVELRARQSAKN